MACRSKIDLKWLLTSDEAIASSFADFYVAWVVDHNE